MRALDVPDWVIERKIIDNRRDLALAKKELDEKELRDVEKSWGSGGSPMAGWGRQTLLEDVASQARKEDRILMNQGKTPREIVQIKSTKLVQKEEEEQL
ncbi:MAG: hypothetical protein Q9183_006131 [Haloplaca sp. 2 TL-2023]